MDCQRKRKLNNTFVFKSFHELLNEVHISSLRRKEIPSVDDETSSYFGESFKKWRELNCTKQFVDFVNELQGEVDSLLLVIHNQKLIADCIEHHLRADDSIALEPLIDLTVQLSRDLQDEFYENHFAAFFNTFIFLLNKHHHDVNIIKNIFLAISFLFKSLQKKFLSNIERTFNLFCPLLNQENYREYINKFAAEAFSFLIRKYKDLRFVLSLVVKAVINDNNLMHGICKLLFEVVKGLKYKFYSHTHQILSKLLDLAGEEEFRGDITEQLLEELWKLMCFHTNRENSTVIVDCTLEILSKSHSLDNVALSIITLKLLLIFIKYKKGCFIINDSHLIKIIEQLYAKAQGLELPLLDITAAILLSDIPAHHHPILLSLAYNEQFPYESILIFTNSIFKMNLFEKDALVPMMKFCQMLFKTNPENVLHALTLFAAKKYDSTISNRECFLRHVPEFGGYLESFVKSFKDIDVTFPSDIHSLWAALLCLPLTKISSYEVKGCVENLVNKTIDAARITTFNVQRKRLLCVLKQAVKVLICLFEDSTILDESLIKLLLSNFNDNEEALAIVVTILEEAPYFKIKNNYFLEWILYLQDNLLAPYSELRHLSLKILFWSSYQLSENVEENNKPNVFKICLEAEEILPSLTTYRDKLKNLQKLSYDAISCHLPKGCDFTIPLRYLISQLYVNFQLMWEPVKILISTYAEGLEINEFWKVFGKQLELSQSKILQKEDNDECIETIANKISLEYLFHCDCFSMYEAKKAERPNVLSFRENLWNCMLGFPRRCENMADAIVPIFFQFLESEYGYKWDNIEYRQNQQMLQENHTKVPDRYLVHHLKLFAAFTEPKRIKQWQKLFDLYMELLQMSSVEVQKAAFSCLLTFRLPYVSPYRDNLERILDEKTLKDELIIFTFEEEKCIVNPLHRSKTVPIVLRVLLGKMKMKIGKDANGRSLGNARINTILTYLASFNSNEIYMLLDLLFAPVCHLSQYDVEVNVKSIMAGSGMLDIPLKKQESILKNIELIFKKLGHKLEAYLHKTLNILLCFGSSCNYFLVEKRESLDRKVIIPLKGIRSSVYGLVIKFFELFQTFPFEMNHIQAIFHALVWPQLNKLTIESTSNPTVLLRLLHCWSKYPRFHILLAKISETHMAPFEVALQTVKEDKTDNSVVDVVYNMIENLLDDEEIEDGMQIVPGPVLDMANIDRQFETNCGTSLVVTFCKDILDCIEKDLRVRNQCGKKKSASLSQQLSILSRLSKYTTDDSPNERLCGLLITLMAKGCKMLPEDEIKTLTSVKYLVSRVEQVSKFIGPLSLLFEKITNAISRIELSYILKEIGVKDGSYKVISDIIFGLNAVDRSRLDEPDYVARMESFSCTSQYLKDRAKRNEDYDLMLLVHNCIFILVNSPDRTLRERSLDCLGEIIRLCIKTLSGENFINQNVVPLLKIHLKTQVEDNRHSMIKLLQLLVVHYENNKIFQAMKNLCHFEDEEKDFFLNIVHIQLHRRARALRKLSQFLSPDLALPPKVLTSYLLPIILSFLKDHLYCKDHDLLTAAIEALSSICAILPWNAYVQLLKDYIDILSRTPENQKVIVRIVVGIMDSFHFDLKNSQYSDQPCPDDVKHEEENVDEAENYVEVMGDKINCCDHGQATKIHRMMERSILPSLNKCLAQKAKSDGQHKLVRDKYAEDEEILRIPIALTMIKLLQKLPRGSLETNLNGIVLKLCYFLGSRAEDIRNIARDTIKRALLCLGPSYLHHFITAMKAHLNRGFQVHVLCFSIWSILDEMTLKAKSKEDNFTLNPGDVDGCILLMNEIFHKELFSDVAEEKDVEAISKKLFEARTSKSYESYKLLSMWMSIEQLPKLILPLKEVLDQTHSHKVINKVSNCLNKITQGLIENKSLSVKFILTFVYGLTSESLSNFVDQGVSLEKQSGHNKHESCLILQSAPPRVGCKPKNDSKANLFILVEFGLNLLHLMLKNSVLDMKEKHHLKLLDPFVLVLSKALDSKHTAVCIASLKCLMRLLRFPLPSMPMHIKKISNKMFNLVKTYSTIGAGKNEHSEMIDWCFKAIQVLVQFVNCHNITEEQLHILLMYSERDLHDYSKHATAFPLLHAILCRKLNAPELPQMMTTVEEMLIKSEMPDVQNKCRKALMTYLLDYPIDTKSMEKHMKFLVKQLEYDYETGRLSAMETINALLKVFPQNMLNNHSEIFFLQLAQSRLNDDSVKCTNFAAQNLKLLLQKISNEEKDKLRKIVFSWMESPKPNVLILMALVLSIFVEVEGINLNKNLKFLLSSLCNLIHPEAFQQIVTTDNELMTRDRLLFCLLDLVWIVLKHCNVIRNLSYAENLNTLWGHILLHCKYDYEPVRLKAAQLFNLLLSSWSPKELVSTSLHHQAEVPKRVKEFLQINFIEKVYTLLGTFTFQLSADLGLELANEVCGNLLNMLEILIEIPEDVQLGDDKKVSVHWLIKRMCHETRVEVIKNRQSSVKRNSIFVWLGAAAEKLGSERISLHLKKMMKPLIRELLDNNPDNDVTLRTLAQQVLDLLKSVAGLEKYSIWYASICKEMSSKKVSTKAARLAQATSNPEIFAKRKIKKNIAKREAKKRKMDQSKPYRSLKKRRLEN